MDAKDWDKEFLGNPDHVNVADRVLAAEVRDLTPKAALDLGCGSGTNALALAELGWTVTGVDWSDRAVGLANEQAEKRGLDATFEVGDITIWRPKQRYDLAVSSYALPGREANAAVLATAAGALAAHGTLLVVEWDRSMAEVWPFDAEDLTTPQEIANNLPSLTIEKAEVRRLTIFEKDDPRAFAGHQANVILVRAGKNLKNRE